MLKKGTVVSFTVTRDIEDRQRVLRATTGKSLDAVTVIPFVRSGMDTATYSAQQRVRSSMMKRLRDEDLSLDDQANQPIMYRGQPTTKGALSRTEEGREVMTGKVNGRVKMIETLMSLNTVDQHIIAKAQEEELQYLREQLKALKG